MRKVLAVFAALAVAAGVVVFWQPAAAAGDPVTPAGRHLRPRHLPVHLRPAR
jgi:Spy/CpxP family protein refolding chaperone